MIDTLKRLIRAPSANHVSPSCLKYCPIKILLIKLIDNKIFINFQNIEYLR